MDIAGVDVEIDVIRELPELEDLEVNPSTEDQSFSSSKYGFKNVIIKGVQGEKLELNPSLEQQNVKGVFTEVNINPIQTKKLSATPTTQEQVISGLFDEVTVNAIEGQELNLNPSEEQQNYEGVFLGVNINPIQVQEITTDLDFSGSDAVEIIAQEGAYIKKATINKDANLTPENIKSGVSILGISGDVADTSDADATSEDIAAGKTAYVNNEKVVGAMEVNNNNALIDTTGITTISNIYKYITKIDMFDTSSATVFDSLFQGFTNLISISLFDTSNVTSFSYVFAGCSSLKEIPKFDTSKVLYMGYAFSGCTNLETVPVLDTSSLNHMNSAFNRCPNLSDESLNNIMQMCINAKKYTLTKTLTAIGINTQVQIDRCKNLSNYQAFLDAGWTTG